MKTATKKSAKRTAKKPTTRKAAARKTPTKKAAKKTRAKKTTARKRAAEKPAPRRQVVIDATNVLCADHGKSRLELLLSMVIAVADRGRDVLCIFDASTPHRLHTSPERDLYRWLLEDKSHHFVQCPGRTEADTLILAEADRMHCPIVSNDFFRDREERYPWVRDPARVLRHQPIREVIYLDETALPVERDLLVLRRELQRLLR